MENMKIIESLEDSGLLIKGVSKTIHNEPKEQKRGFLSMLLGTLSVNSLGHMLTGKGVNRAGDGIIRTGYGSTRTSNNKIF